MKFELKASKYFYKDNEINEINELKLLGFEFEIHSLYGWHLKENTEIELDSLEELMEFTMKWGQCVVDNGTIEIYNDYRE